MFYNCNSLSAFANISRWNIKNVTNKSCIFSNYYLLTSLPETSELSLNKVKDIPEIFRHYNRSFHISSKKK